jgi:hypothetical protein
MTFEIQNQHRIQELEAHLLKASEGNALIIHALNCALQLVEALIAFTPNNTPLHPGVATAKGAAALQAQRTDALERKGESFTKALLSAMSLVDQLLQENVRLCAASNEPPPIQLFAAKNSFDTAMKKLLGDVN